MHCFKATIAYDGTDFLGFQIQAQGRTVQACIEKALTKITGQTLRIIAAGRTDRGVHAEAQVIAFKLTWPHGVDALFRALSVNLPPDIGLKQLERVVENFHPRFDALSRCYRYTILNQPLRDVMAARYTLHVPQLLDVEAMQRASRSLLGVQDFFAFGKPPKGQNTVRHIMQAKWHQVNNKIIFEIEANAFLYRMVRNIVGTLLRIGLGKLASQELNDIIATKNRSRVGPAAKACGLSLVQVKYPRGL